MARSRYEGTRMFHLVTRTWNPVTGCRHDCVYCWARKLVETRLSKITEKYREGFSPRLHRNELRAKFRPNELVFVCDMGDLFGEWVPDEWIMKVFGVIRRYPRTDFLLLTKNPFRYVELLEKYGAEVFSKNMIFGTTIETLDDDLYNAYRISRAPPPSLRLQWLGIFVDKMVEQAGYYPKTFISVEPILLYWTTTDIEVFANIVAERIKPIAVYVGYDNYSVTEKLRIPEPSLDTTRKLIEALRSRGITVYTLSLIHI